MELESLPWYGQLAVFLVIGAVLFGIFYFVVYSPKSEQIARIQNESADLEKQIRIAERNESKLAKIEEEIKYKTTQLDKLKAILPEKKEVDSMVRRIQALASTARLRVDLIQPQATQQREIYEEWPTKFKMQGNYHNLAIFFDSLSRQPKIYNIDGLSIVPLAQMSDQYTVAADFLTFTYIYHELEVQKPAAKRAARAARSGDKIDDSGGV